MKKTMTTICIMLAALQIAGAQQVLTLDECRQMAVQSDKTLEQARTKMEMAEYDKKIAMANWFPNINATGAYMHNHSDISLISDDMSAKLTNMGSLVQGEFSTTMTNLTQAIMTNPAAAQEYAKSPMWQTVIGALSKSDVSTALNQLGGEIDGMLHPDLSNIYAGVVSLQQPVFMGGKIIAANQIAALAAELARTQYEGGYEETMVAVDQAYWQIVSIAGKKKLAESYAGLLHEMQKNAEIAVREGVATEADVLTVKVKSNEADMMLTKATNGLSLAKMLLCKQIGLPLDSDIVLADENSESIALPSLKQAKSMDEIYAARPETRSLELASQIYDKKVNVARADMLPKVALTMNYIYSNPNLKNGFSNSWGGMFNAGVMVTVPIFHGFEAVQKTRKAKAEATLYKSQYQNALDLINLQVSQIRKQQDEAYEKLIMAESNLNNAEENLRIATAGFEAGVIEPNVTLQAQTAWLQAHSELIDTQIEIQMLNSNLMKAEGDYTINEIKK